MSVEKCWDKSVLLVAELLAEYGGAGTICYVHSGH